MVDGVNKLVVDDKPNLMIWQTGTYDAVRGTDPEDFRATVFEGVENLHAGGADVVLVNMQYSPRTESIMALGAYADGLCWVGRGHALGGLIIDAARLEAREGTAPK